MGKENKLEFTQREAYNDNQMILIFDGKEKKIFDEKSFMKRNKFDGVIRIQKDEFSKIDSKKKFLTHFNLEICQHKVGHIYLLPKIVKRGYFKSNEDYLHPVLDFENCYIGKCVEVKEKLSYDKLKKEYFEYSMKHIKNLFNNSLVLCMGIV